MFIRLFVNIGNLEQVLHLRKKYAFFLALKMKYEIWYKFLVQILLQIQVMNVINIDVKYQLYKITWNKNLQPPTIGI